MPAALALARGIAGHAPLAVQASKRIAMPSPTTSCREPPVGQVNVCEVAMLAKSEGARVCGRARLNGASTRRSQRWTVRLWDSHLGRQAALRRSSRFPLTRVVTIGRTLPATSAR